MPYLEDIISLVYKEREMLWICRSYYYLPYDEEKPILWVKSVFEDHRRRMYNANMIEKIAGKLEDGLADVNEMMKQERPFPERRLRGVLEELGSSCSRYQTLNQGKSSGGGAQPGRNKLDKERHRLCQREVVCYTVTSVVCIPIPNTYFTTALMTVIRVTLMCVHFRLFHFQESIGMMARTLKATVNKTNIKDKLKATHILLNRLRQTAIEPQHALPDIFIWMVSNNKRVAYQRIPAKDIIYSMVDEERGTQCGRIQALLLKVLYDIQYIIMLPFVQNLSIHNHASLNVIHHG